MEASREFGGDLVSSPVETVGFAPLESADDAAVLTANEEVVRVRKARVGIVSGSDAAA